MEAVFMVESTEESRRRNSSSSTHSEPSSPVSLNSQQPKSQFTGSWSGLKDWIFVRKPIVPTQQDSAVAMKPWRHMSDARCNIDITEVQ